MRLRGLKNFLFHHGGAGEKKMGQVCGSRSVFHWWFHLEYGWTDCGKSGGRAYEQDKLTNVSFEERRSLNPAKAVYTNRACLHKTGRKITNWTASDEDIFVVAKRVEDNDSICSIPLRVCGGCGVAISFKNAVYCAYDVHFCSEECRSTAIAKYEGIER